VGAELAFERSGPERYLSSTQLLLEMLHAADPDDPRQAEALGRIVASYGTLRQMSLGVAGMLARARTRP
jgi:acyl-CoA dehydrogenase